MKGLFSSNFSQRRTHARVFPKSVHDKVRAFWFVFMDYGCFSLSMLDFSLGLYLALSYRLMSISIEGKVDIIFGSSASPRGSQYANKEVIQKQGMKNRGEIPIRKYMHIPETSSKTMTDKTQ